MRRLILSLLAGVVAMPAAAQTVVVSDAPEATSITLYRDPNRGGDQAINRSWLNGFALVTETRTITIPAGTAVIRFEGVSSGILSESAIVTGLPSDVSEKNLDADLLSPRSLYDRSLGRRVTIRRTDALGQVREEQAVIRSGADGAAVLETADGFEALRCSGLNETIVYDAVPSGLSARPTLSIETTSPVARTVTVQLSYLAGGFDWQADYVVTMQGDGTARMFGWITLASTDATSYPDAQAQVVAGRTNRTSNYARQIGAGGPLSLQCWPEVSYDELDRAVYGGYPPPPAPPAPPAPTMMARADAIVVTGSRIARQEDLGDLKLYRVPQPTTVAAKAQKQVALMDKTGVQLRPVYVSELYGAQIQSMQLQLRGENKVSSGLGLALPAGPVALFEDTRIRPILIGEASLDDVPVGEDVELRLAAGPSVVATLDVAESKEGEARLRLSVTNANPWPVEYEAVLSRAGAERIDRASSRLAREDGETLWRVRVPANGSATLNYRSRQPR
ncbi:DUF4139 domain-containing protein [Sphingomonas sp. AX6]|uniref:DUF4139 domain-containing protein n=1 Tax=Sphingomonas sp. AX6 TaxID=2653171 RepID=UPI0012F146E9|nr:hypothetical protein [Sphingomonas sp. AX6]VXC71693.1 conserved exported hypothetical protein [Sphingomonas sp. AX6]